MKAASLVPQKDQLADLFDKFKTEICINDSPYVSNLRFAALNSFSVNGFPTQTAEEWRSTSLIDSLAPEYNFYFEPSEEKIDVDKIFRCEISNFETLLFTQLNGWYVYKQYPLTEFHNGVIVGSMAHAFKIHPEIISRHYGKIAHIDNNGLTALNTAFAQDGIFIYIPDNITVEKPVQMVNIVNTGENLFIQPRNLIILGKNAKLTLVYCDDSIKHQKSFINACSEVFLDENACLDYYKLQNKDNLSTVITNSFFNLEKNSRLNTNTLTLNGGVMRNETYVSLKGTGAEAKIYGLYLVDREQHVDNQVYADHIAPETTSFEQFKGIIDDNASAVFNGHIHVCRDAQKTEAYQSNKNILLTDTAHVSSKPFLEIYADDVKCSHGATVGQLDPEALFYLKSRGICDRNARMLLMYAFAGEIVNKINIGVLRERLDAMIIKRLKGELSICDQCVLHCKENDMIKFEIDMSKV
ncbi:MAG TPA: Fe-S cluster assembly protein SufD [Bacteroidales bacterium]|nr:Fe-S cluster assembly protein SufD [Bacteroidales bacterium]